MKPTYRRFAGTALVFLILNLFVGPAAAAGGALGYAIVQRRAKTAGLKKPFYYRIANVGFGIVVLFAIYELLLLIAQGRSDIVGRWLNATEEATIAVERLFGSIEPAIRNSGLSGDAARLLMHFDAASVVLSLLIFVSFSAWGLRAVAGRTMEEVSAAYAFMRAQRIAAKAPGVIAMALTAGYFGMLLLWRPGESGFGLAETWLEGHGAIWSLIPSSTISPKVALVFLSLPGIALFAATYGVLWLIKRRCERAAGDAQEASGARVD